MKMTSQSFPSIHRSFATLNPDEIVNPDQIFVLGSDGKLWLERGPWNSVPPARVLVDANVAAFQSLTPEGLLILDLGGDLWLEGQPGGSVPPQRTRVDSNVVAFDGMVTLDGQQAYVLDGGGTLWLDHGPWGTVPPSRTRVDVNVISFQTLGPNMVFVLDRDLNLWLENGPWATVPRSRRQIDRGVAAFQALNDAQVLVLGTDGNLWLESAPWGPVPPSRQQVGGSNIVAFQAVPNSPADVFVLSSDGRLWLNTVGNGAAGPQIDGDVSAFQPLNKDQVVVLGSDGKLWLENGPWVTVPPLRQQIDGNISMCPSNITINSYPNVSGLNGTTTLTVWDNGAYLFSGGWSPSNWGTGLVAQDVNLVLTMRDSQGTVWVFSTSGTVAPEGNYSFNQSGANASFAASWKFLSDGYGWHDEYNAGLDLEATWTDIEAWYNQNKQTIDQVVQVIGDITVVLGAAITTPTPPANGRLLAQRV